MRVRNFRRRVGSGLAGAIDEEEGESMMDTPDLGNHLKKVHGLFYTQLIHPSTADGYRHQDLAQAITNSAGEAQNKLCKSISE